jgi:iron complex transport system permease protein
MVYESSTIATMPNVVRSRCSRRGAALLALAVLVSAAAGLCFGAESVSIGRALSDATSMDRTIVLALRMPRVLLALMAGAALSGAGVGLQGTLRNPLAEPFVLGVSGGAALGACCAIALGFDSSGLLGAWIVPLFAIVGGGCATAVVLVLARSETDRPSLLLAGIAVNAIAASAITLLKTVVSSQKSQELLFWLTGFLSILPSPRALAVLFVYVASGLMALLWIAPRINLLALGDDAAASLGLRVRHTTLLALLLASLLTGAVVSLTGLIGFVGLVVPHVARRMVGSDQRLLLPAAVALGGAFLVLCDLGSRVFFNVVHTEIPVGAITAAFGGPVFLLQLRRPRRGAIV